MTSVDELLLVLLGAEPGSAYDLQRRHAEIFGTVRQLDIARVRAAVNRLERGGYLRTEAVLPVRKDTMNRPLCHLTPAGVRRQHTWLTAVRADSTADEVYVRGMVAVELADPAVFDAFLAEALASATRRRQDLSDAGSLRAPTSGARAAFEWEQVDALVRWLERLPTYRRSTV
ncbi:hypothetical protein R8Z50_13230 [Longispora sp. K20-0274]|uniref:hypothetical protein n=1 Tax=Longispora sp. K20-0274 TaxID=3088255 RepID=UPI00399AF2C8